MVEETEKPITDPYRIINFTPEEIDFAHMIVEKEKERDNALSFNDAIHEHKRQLKEAEASPLIRQISKDNEKKVIDRVETLFVDKKEFKGDESPI